MKVRKRKTKETNRPIFSKKSINEPNELNTSAVEIPMYVLHLIIPCTEVLNLSLLLNLQMT